MIDQSPAYLNNNRHCRPAHVSHRHRRRRRRRRRQQQLDRAGESYFNVSPSVAGCAWRCSPVSWSLFSRITVTLLSSQRLLGSQPTEVARSYTIIFLSNFIAFSCHWEVSIHVTVRFSRHLYAFPPKQRMKGNPHTPTKEKEKNAQFLAPVTHLPLC